MSASGERLLIPCGGGAVLAPRQALVKEAQAVRCALSNASAAKHKASVPNEEGEVRNEAKATDQSNLLKT